MEVRIVECCLLLLPWPLPFSCFLFLFGIGDIALKGTWQEGLGSLDIRIFLLTFSISSLVDFFVSGFVVVVSRDV